MHSSSYELNYTNVLVDCISTDSPGYLLVSDSEGISYYYTQAAQLETPGARADVRSLLSARRISGNVYIAYYICKDGCESLYRGVGRGFTGVLGTP